jgi:hypothetical protein
VPYFDILRWDFIAVALVGIAITIYAMARGPVLSPVLSPC